MSESINFSTFYRPTTFSDVVGQDIPKTVLKKIAAADGISARAIFLKGSYGSGKCVEGNTRVATSTGYRKIKDLFPNATYGFHEFETVVPTRKGFDISSHWYKEFDCQVIYHELINGFVVNGTADHRILAFHNGEICLHRMEDLTIGDYILFPKRIIGENWKKRDTLCYLTGLWLAAQRSFLPQFLNCSDIPEYVFNSAASSRIDFVKGWLNSRGYINKRGDVELYTRSSNLVKQLQELLYTLGLSARTLWEISNGDVVWTLRIPAEQSAGFFLSKNGREWFCSNPSVDDKLPSELKNLQGYNFEEIINTKYSLADVYDLSVPQSHEFYCQGTYNHNTTLCRIFAKAMNCENFKKLGDVCNSCAPCLEASSPNSQTYYEFDSSVVGNVESIRGLREKLSYSPPQGLRRVVVFDEIHACTNAALNAMLKMVEDGIPNTIFVFASTEDILPTIKSRSVCLDITTIPHSLMKDRLSLIAKEANLSITDSALDQICIKSGGHMRDALSFLQLYSLSGVEGLKSSYSLLNKFFSSAFSKNFQVAESTLLEILKFNIVDIRNSLYLFIRNCYISTPNTELYKYSQSGIVNKLFGYFFSPVNQIALKDEVGLEIVFRAFLKKLSSK